MKLVWHIFQKDVRRLRLPLFLWGAVYLLHYVVFLQLRAGDNGRPRPPRPDAFSPESYLQWLWGLELLAAWILVPQFIQDDSLTGDRAFWRTRPISGGRLLAAKLLGLGVLLGGGSTLLLLPWWIDLGFGAVEIVRLSVMNLIGMGMLVGLAAAIATVTADLIRFLAWSFIVLAAIGLGLFVIMAGSAGIHLADVGIATFITRIEIGGPIVLLGAGVIVLVQYLSRRRPTAIVIATVTAVSAGLVVVAWPWSAAELGAKIGGPDTALPEPTIRILNSTVFSPPDPKRQKATLEVRMQLADGDAWRDQSGGWIVDGVLRHGTKGRLPVIGPLLLRSRDPLRETAHAVIQRENGGSPPRAPMLADWRMDLPGALAAEFQAGATELSAEAMGELWRTTESVRFPLQAGAFGVNGLISWHVHAVTPEIFYITGATSSGWAEIWRTEPAFMPDALLLAFGGDPRRWRQTRLLVGANAESGSGDDDSDRPRYKPLVRIGLINLSWDNLTIRSSENLTAFTTMGGRSILENNTVAAVTFREVARLRATSPLTRLNPDVFIDGDLPRVLTRSRDVRKQVLVISWAGDFNPGVQNVPPQWMDPEVRRLISERFLCAQIFNQEDPHFGRPRYPGDGFPKVFVLNPDGSERDALRPAAVVSWRDALEANLAGSNYAAWLRQEIARRGAAGEAIRYRLSDALLARGEIETAIDEMLDYPNTTLLFNFSRERELAVLAESPVVRSLLERRHAETLTRLKRDPTDAQAALRLYRASSGLHSTELWPRFPALVPTENPARWRVLSDWLLRSDPIVYHQAANEGFDLEQFILTGGTWARNRLEELRQSPTTDYRLALADTRFRLTSVGIRAVQMLVADKKTAAAQRIAETVVQRDSSSETRKRVERALSGRPGDFDSWWWR